MAQALFNDRGGYRENRSPPHEITVEGDGVVQGNIASVFDVEGNHLGDIAYRPHEVAKWGHRGLFLC